MSFDLERLIAACREYDFTPAEREEQRRSFAFGNTSIENDRITREMVDEQADLLQARAK